jgi:hypothetical protein
MAMRRALSPVSALMMAVVLVVAIVAPRVSAEEVQYPDGTGRDGAEMICEAYSQAFGERWNRKIGVFYKTPNPNRERKMFRWAGQHLRTTNLQLGAVSWPAEDQPAITLWLEKISLQPELLESLAATVGGNWKLRHHAERRLVRNGEIANRIVAQFNFHYCRFDRGLPG